METCSHCNSTIFAEGLRPGQKIRCANCNAISTFGVAKKTPADRWAWRSLYLGIASFVLLFLTGIPAIYYGTRSLLRMRFIPSKPGDKTAAVSGIFLGGCVGVIFGGMAVAIGLVIAVVASTREEIKDQQLVLERCETIFEIQPPEFCKPTRATRLLNKDRIYFEHFQDDVEQMEIMLQSDLTLTQSDIGFHVELRTRSLNGKFKSSPELPREKLTWKFGTEEVEVNKRILVPNSNGDEDDSVGSEERLNHYWATRSSERKMYGMSVIFNPSRVNFNEEQARELFANTRIVALDRKSPESETAPPTNSESSAEAESNAKTKSNSDSESKTRSDKPK